jgi:glycosyltransferase involved in cell wall biosynthesis
MKNPTTALCLIARDKADIILNALESTKGIFDRYCLADNGSKDNTVKVFRDWCKKNNKEYKISERTDFTQIELEGKTMLGDYSQARNESFKLAEGCKYAMWIDTDDIIENVETLPKIIEQMEKDKIDMAIMTYDYAPAQDGKKAVVQERERIINLETEGYWIDPVHETYHIHKAQPSILRVMPDTMKIVHQRHALDFIVNSRRNNAIMTKYIEDHGLKKTSEKMIRNLAYDHWEYKEWKEAIKYYEHWLTLGIEIAELRYQVYLKLGRAYLGIGEHEKAIISASKCIDHEPRRSDGYFLMAEIYMAKRNWQEVLHYTDRVLELGKPQTSSPQNEMEYRTMPLEMKVISYIGLENLSEAEKILRVLMKENPSIEKFRINYDGIQKEKKKNNLVKLIAEGVNYYQCNNRADRIKDFLRIIPNELRDDNTVRKLIAELKHDFKRKTQKIKLKGEKRIDIFAGPFFEKWDGNSDTGKGIGGSESMAIQLSRNLAKLGNKVTIYNECDPCEVDGVRYERYEKWSKLNKADVFISLRKPDIFEQLISAKKQYLWLHDTEYSPNIPTSIWYSPNKIIVLSEFHKDIIKRTHGLTDDKIFWISRNGLNEKVKVPKIERQKNKFIYASSYDRGLDFALKNWNRVKEQIPEAELHVYYGWDTFDALKQVRSPEYRDWMENFQKEINELMKQDGIIHHGRVSQAELYKAFAESNIWYYPTSFLEISCITAMTSQRYGAIPVCTPIGALRETVQHGARVDRKDIMDALVYTYNNPDEARREKMMKWAKDKFDMPALAKEWDLFFNQN